MNTKKWFGEYEKVLDAHEEAMRRNYIVRIGYGARGFYLEVIGKCA